MLRDPDRLEPRQRLRDDPGPLFYYLNHPNLDHLGLRDRTTPGWPVLLMVSRDCTPCYIVGFATTNHALYFSWPQQTKVCPPAALAASLLACLLSACCRCMLSRLVSCSTCVLLCVAPNPLSYALCSQVYSTCSRDFDRARRRRDSRLRPLRQR